MYLVLDSGANINHIMCNLNSVNCMNPLSNYAKPIQELSSCAACFYEPSLDSVDPEIMYHISSIAGRDVNFFLCDTCLTEYYSREYIVLCQSSQYTYNPMVEVHFHQVYLVRDHQSTNF